MFSKVYPFIAKWEGGLDDDPVDRGGITHYGVSIAFLSDLAKTLPNRDVLQRIGIVLPITRQTIIDLTRDQARALFQWQFWNVLNCGDYPIKIAAVLSDAAVNCGRKAAVKFVQRAFHLTDDGILGPKTRAKLLEAAPKDVEAAIAAREEYYRAIVRNRPSQNKFLKGWLNRTRDLRKFITTL